MSKGKLSKTGFFDQSNSVIQFLCVTAAASGTEYSGEVTTGDLLSTCYFPTVWDTRVVCDY